METSPISKSPKKSACGLYKDLFGDVQNNFEQPQIIFLKILKT